MTATVGSAPLAVTHRRTSSVRDIVILVSLVLIGTASCLIRVPGAHHDVVWAEDGEIFLAENLQDGPFATLFRGYAGYQHLVPRIGSALAIAFADLDDYAQVTFVMCAVLTGAIGAAVYWLSAEVLVWVPARVAVALITFTLPLATQEVVGNWADIHTYFLWLTPWLLFHRPRSWATGIAWGLLTFVAVMTEVQAILFLAAMPFLLRRREGYSLPIWAGLLAGSAIQVATTLAAPRESTASWLGFSSLARGWLINTTMPMLVADPDQVRRVLASTGLLIPIVVAACFLVAFVVALILGSPRQRLLAVVLALASAAIYAAGATVAGSWWFRYGDGDAPMWERAINIRYGVAAGMMLAALVPVAAAALVRRAESRGALVTAAKVTGAAAMVAMIVVFSLASTRAVSVRGWVTSQWSAAVHVAAAECQDLSPQDVRSLPIAPLRDVELTCEQITR